ncbi:MAG: LysR family transcriptional regulator [Hyphomicrobiales bacterium]|nr:LysR family transcriptional regulator [Hyphomicrobiales bacterium]MCP5370896.1 LysR family transcriptional regulator [Hyphomicrobiales bacterium]
MDVRQLRTFLHVAELGSFSRAAERLRIAQPALGRQVRLLEEELGVRLFTRHGRGVTLTPPGKVLLDRAAAILRQLERARVDVAAEGGAESGHVVVGLPPTVADILAGPLVARFHDAHPRISLRVVVGFSGFLQEWLLSGRMDLAVLYTARVARNLRAEPLLTENLFLVGPGGCGLAPDAGVPFADLARRPLILPSPSHGLRALVDETAAARGIDLTVPVEADGLRILKDLVVRGLGYTVLPLAPIHAEVTGGLFAAAPIVAPDLTRRVVLAGAVAGAQGRPAPPPVAAFGQVLRGEVRRMVEAGEWSGVLL